jgi:SAM-dependent methyltransferase|tara:strand:+ start:3612 stop:4559 length:948 start_codon:yes stop_codon:yes gene_type:complete
MTINSESYQHEPGNLENIETVNSCPICFSKNYREWLAFDDEQLLKYCKDCGTGYLAPYPSQIENLYQDYGDHITKLPPKYFESRLNIGYKKAIIFKIIKRTMGNEINLLDYGGGAGFFMSAAQRSGIQNSYLFEPSENFRRTAIEKVGIDESYVTDDLSKLNVKFKFVSMLDVIEHLPQEKIHILLRELSSQMKPGGYLFGETPNRLSLNLRIFGKKDPVICPPSHLLYFTKNSLHKLLLEHGFERQMLFTMGVSTNSFFRKSRFKPSFVEQPNSFAQKLISYFIKVLFKFFGLIATFTGTGYQIIFLYKLKAKK